MESHSKAFVLGGAIGKRASSVSDAFERVALLGFLYRAAIMYVFLGIFTMAYCEHLGCMLEALRLLLKISPPVKNAHVSALYRGALTLRTAKHHPSSSPPVPQKKTHAVMPIHVGKEASKSEAKAKAASGCLLRVQTRNLIRRPESHCRNLGKKPGSFTSCRRFALKVPRSKIL